MKEKQKGDLYLYAERGQLNVLEHIISKEILENVTFIGHIGGKTDKGKQPAACLMSLCECMAECGVGEMIKRVAIES